MKVNIDTDKNIIEVDDQQISNFSITQIQDNAIYAINNGKHTSYIARTTGSLIEFKRLIYMQGNFWFAGNKKQLDAVLYKAYMLFLNIP